MKKKVLVVANNASWKSWPEKMEALKSWFAPRVDLEFSLVHTNFNFIPWEVYDPATGAKGVSKVWYNTFIAPLANKHDMILFVVNKSQWEPVKARGWRGGVKNGAVALQLGADEYEPFWKRWLGLDGEMFHQVARHELCHGLFFLACGPDVRWDLHPEPGTCRDTTHYWWDLDQLEKALVNLVPEEPKTPMNKLELFYPYRPFRVNQSFGDSAACVYNFNQKTQRIVGKVNGVCPAGSQELYPLLGMKGHTGVDLYAPDGVILRSPLDGFVEEVQTEVERGLGVGIVTHDKRDFGPQGEHHAKVRQWHLKAIWVKQGQHVLCGDPIGLADNTGFSAGSHNHFELKPVQKNAQGIWQNVYQQNGYFGAIDPMPFFNGMYAEDFASYRSQLSAILTKLNELLQKMLR